MKYQFFFVVILFLAYSAFGAETPNVTVTGIVQTFDGDTVKLKDHGKIFTVPRAAILPEFQLRRGELVKAQIKRPTKPSSN